MDIFFDPTVYSVLKVVGAAIAVVMGIPFIIGLVIGWIAGRRF